MFSCHPGFITVISGFCSAQVFRAISCIIPNLSNSSIHKGGLLSHFFLLKHRLIQSFIRNIKNLIVSSKCQIKFLPFCVHTLKNPGVCRWYFHTLLSSHQSRLFARIQKWTLAALLSYHSTWLWDSGEEKLGWVVKKNHQVHNRVNAPLWHLHFLAHWVFTTCPFHH